MVAHSTPGFYDVPFWLLLLCHTVRLYLTLPTAQVRPCPGLACGLLLLPQGYLLVCDSIMLRLFSRDATFVHPMSQVSDRKCFDKMPQLSLQM